MATNLNFKWGKTLSANSPALQAGTIYVATEERAMYVDAVIKNGESSETKRIRLGDVIFYDSLSALKTAIAAGDELTSSALYYLAQENALAKWDNVKKQWTIINDTSELSRLIGVNAAAIEANAGEITALKTRATNLETRATNLEAADVAIDKRLDDIEASLGTGGGIGDRLAAVEGDLSTAKTDITNLKSKDAELEGAIALKAADADLQALTNTVGTLSTTVENNKVDAANATKEVADDLAGYKTTNDGRITTLERRVGANESAIAALQGEDTRLSGEISRVEGLLGNYVLTSTYSTDKAELEEDIRNAASTAQTGVDNAKTAQDTADQAVSDAAAADAKAATGIQKAEAAQKSADDNSAAITGINNKIGTVASDTTVVAMIGAVATEAATNLSNAETRLNNAIQTNSGDIAELQGDLADIVDGESINSFSAVESELASIRQSVGEDKSSLTEDIEAAQAAADQAQEEVDALEGVVDAFKTATNNSIAALEGKDAEHDQAIAKKLDTTTHEAFVKSVNEKSAADDLLIKANADAIAELVAADIEINKDIAQNASDIAGLDGRLTTAEGTLKTAVETTIPGLEGRIGTLETNMSNYATITYVDGEVDKLELAIGVAQGTADQAVSDAATADGKAVAAQEDATDALNQLTAIKNSDKLDSFKDVEDAIAAGFAANDAMVFKGVVNSASDFASEPESGWTYKVATAGTYHGQVSQVGDLFIYVDGAWQYVPSGNEDVDQITISSANGVISIASQENVASGSVAIVSGSDSIVVDGSTANQIAISMVWGEF